MSAPRPMAPRIIPPVSPCTRSISVSGQPAGSTVRVYWDVSGEVVGSCVSDTGRVDVPITGKLGSGGGAVWATCEVDQGTTKVTSHPSALVNVGPKAQAAARPWAVLPVYDGALSLTVAGLAPGTDLVVTDNSGQLLSTTDTNDGVALAGFDLSVGGYPASGGSVAQSVCGSGGPSLQLPQPTAHAGDRLPALGATTPMACDRCIGVSGIVHGARIDLHRASGSTTWITTSADTDIFDLVPAARAGETITLRQRFVTDYSESSPTAVVVGPITDMPAPILDGPLCPNSRYLHVRNLWPGTDVLIENQSGPLYQGTADGFDTLFTIDGLPAGTVYARVGRCGHWSAPSNGVTVGAPPKFNPPIVIDQPYACESAVWVHKVPPGSVVTVFDRDSEASLGVAFAAGPTAVVGTPPLRAGQTIAALAAVRNEGDFSEDVRVLDHDRPAAARVDPPPVEGHRKVEVIGLTPGAQAAVLVRAGSQTPVIASAFRVTSKGASTNVDLGGPLKHGQTVQVVQTACGMTVSGPAETVGTPPPSPPPPPPPSTPMVRFHVVVDQTAQGAPYDTQITACHLSVLAPNQSGPSTFPMPVTGGSAQGQTALVSPGTWQIAEVEVDITYNQSQNSGGGTGQPTSLALSSFSGDPSPTFDVAAAGGADVTIRVVHVDDTYSSGFDLQRTPDGTRSLPAEAGRVTLSCTPADSTSRRRRRTVSCQRSAARYRRWARRSSRRSPA